MSKLKLICLAGGITVGLGLLLYRHGKRLVFNSRCNQNQIGKEVVTFKPPTTQKPTSPPPQPECSSLVIRDLMNQWEVNPSFKVATCVQQGSTVIQIQPKVGDIIKNDEFTMLRLAFAKTPLMVLNDLYKHVKIKLQHHPTGTTNNITIYTDNFEIGSITFSDNDICKIQAKQNKCALLFRNKLENELECSSLGIHDLMNQWEVNPSFKVATCVQQGSTVIQIQPKAGDIIKNDEFTMLRLAFAKTPLMVLNDLYKHVKIKLQHHPTGTTNNITIYTDNFEIGSITFSDNDICKIQAKQNKCALLFRNKLENELECSSLGIHDLMNQWEVNPSFKVATCVQQGSTVIQIQPKTGDIIKNDEFTMLRLAFAKTPLMVFNDLYKHVKIKLQHHPTGATNHITSYTATFEIGSITFSGNDICKQKAKQKACASFFWNKFKNDLDGSSLSIRDLMNQWEVNPSFKVSSCVQQGSTVIQIQPKAGNIIKIDENTMLRLAFAKTPLMVFNDLYKHVKIKLQHHPTDATNNITSFTASFEIGSITYSGNDICKKLAKQKACASFFSNKFENELKRNTEFSEIENEEKY